MSVRLKVIVLLFFPFLLFSQNDKKGIDLLFNKTDTYYYSDLKLSEKDKSEIYNLLKLNLSKDKNSFVISATPKEIKEYGITSVQVYTEVKVIDLNNDGILEVFVSLSNYYEYGNSGRDMLFIKSNGKYILNEEFIGTILLVNFNNNKFPEIIIGGPGFEFPLCKWDNLKKEYKVDRYVSDDFKTISFKEFYNLQKAFNKSKQK